MMNLKLIKMKNTTYLNNKLTLLLILFAGTICQAQIDSTPIERAKVHHIEPLFLDLVRDLGARKGEKEFNVGADFVNTTTYSQYDVLAEYEFAPIDRLGLEIETDFSFYNQISDVEEIPQNKLDNIRIAAQYSFYVSPKYNTTVALGYTQVVKFIDFENSNNNQLVTGLQYIPSIIAAKRWGDQFHTLLLAGPILKHTLDTEFTDVDWQFNTSVDYEIPNSSHFIGIEFNKKIVDSEFRMTMRPQGKIQINEGLAIGLVAGFPITKSQQKFSSFFRVIYEL